MKSSIAVCVVVLCLVHMAQGSTGIDSSYVQRTHGEKSTTVALGWALGSTIIPTAGGLVISGLPGGVLCLYGVLIGPSTGHFYAHQWNRGFTTVEIRTAIAGIGALASLAAFGELMSDDDDDGTSVGVIAGITLACVTSTIIYDIVTTPSSVCTYNGSLKTGKVHIVPNIDIARKRSGISIAYRF